MAIWTPAADPPPAIAPRRPSRVSPEPWSMSLKVGLPICPDTGDPLTTAANATSGYALKCTVCSWYCCISPALLPTNASIQASCAAIIRGQEGKS